MNLTINSKMELTISGIGPDEIKALVSMIRGAGLEERRQWFPILETLTKTPFDQLKRDKMEYLEKLVEEVEQMRRCQKLYFKNRTQGALKASIEHERTVDDLVRQIQYKL